MRRRSVLSLYNVSNTTDAETVKVLRRSLHELLLILSQHIVGVDLLDLNGSSVFVDALDILLCHVDVDDASSE